MRWRAVLGLYLVAAALAAEYWFVERLRPAPNLPVPRERFLPVEADDVHEVRLLRAGRRIVSRRSGDRWAIVEPEGAPVPSDLIAAFTKALTATEQIQRVAGPEADARSYGLDNGAAQVELVPRSGRPLVVTLGATNPTGTALYARRAGVADVILIGRDVRYYEDLIFQALAAVPARAVDDAGPVGRCPDTTPHGVRVVRAG
jgi:hypothetical protein